MTALVASELVKLRTVRAFWGYLVAVVALAALGAAGTIGSATESDRGAESFPVDLAEVASVATLIGLVLGIVLVTAEFRHGTITPTFLVTPVRERVLAAKAAAGVLGGIALGALALAVVAAVAVPWLLALGEAASPGGETLEAAARVVLQAVLTALLGVAVGALVHGQVAALIGALLWFLVVEPLVGALLGIVDLDGVPPYLPTRTIDAVVGGDTAGSDALGLGAAVLVSLGWIALIGGLGVVRTRRTDVT